MEYTITTGNDGREYARFETELDLELYMTDHGIDATVYCCDGYMNAILLDDVVAA